jgi:lysophospholipase L1-like esterase
MSSMDSPGSNPAPSGPAAATPAPAARPGLRRRPRRRTRLLAAAASILLALGVCELALRLFWHNSYRGDSGAYLLPLHVQQGGRDYRLPRRFLDAEVPAVHLRTDQRRYILPSFQHQDPDVTIAFFGGSTTECSIVQEELRFPALVSTLLGRRGIRANTLNVAAAGTTAHDSVNVLYNHVVFDRPDIAVLMHATNDFGVLAAEGGYRSRTGGALGLRDQWRWIKERITRHVYLAALVRKALANRGVRYQDPREIAWRTGEVADLPVEEFRRRLRAFVHLCRIFQIEPVLMTQPLAGITNQMTPAWANPRAQDRMNEVIRAVGREEGAEVIDLARHLLEDVPLFATAPAELLFDGMHVTDAGSRVYAEHIAEHLLPLVRRVMDASSTAPQAPAGGP